MTQYAEHVAVGLLIRGCPDPEGGGTFFAPVLWVNRDVQTISGATGNLIGCNIRGRLKAAQDGVDGFVQQVSLQDLLGQGSQMKFKLMDEPKKGIKRDLGQLFAPDPALFATTSWQIKTSTAYLGKGQTNFDLVGFTAPQVGQVLWVENEAFRITARTDLSQMSFHVDVARGMLGSRDREHVIKPSQYPAGSNGSDFGLLATSRPDFDRYSFEVEVHYFTLDGNTATPTEMWPRMTEGRPTPQGVGIEWVVTTIDVLGFVQKRKIKRSALKLSMAVVVCNLATGIFVDLPPTVPEGFSVGSPNNAPPGKIRIWLTPYEAERFFDRRFRLPFTDSLAPTDISEFNSRFTAYPTAATRRVISEILLKCGGYNWVYRISTISYNLGPEWNYALGRQYIFVEADLWSFIDEDGKVSGCGDKPCPGYPAAPSISVSPSDLYGFVGPGYSVSVQVGQMTAPKRNPVFNMGWSHQDADPIRTQLGEEPPEIKLRLWLDGMRPIEQIQALLLSGQGGGQNDPDFDLICCGLCPEVDPAFLNRGAATGTPITNDPRTSELLQVDELLRTVETVPLELDNFDLGQQLRRILRTNSLIASYVAGGLTFRQISATSQSSVTALKQVTGSGRLVETGNRAPAMKSLSVRGGHHPMSLTPGWEQPIYLFDGGDPEAGESLDVYPPGGALTPEQWFSGPMSTLLRVTFMMQRGNPPTYRVPAKRQRGAIYPGDAVTWSDASIVGPNGRGSSANRFGRWVVVGRDFNPWTGDQQVLLMTDQVNDITTDSNSIGAAYLVTRIGLNAAGNYSVQIQALTAASSVSLIDPLQVINACFENGGYVRVLCEDLHNPNLADPTSRPGALETYGVVIAYQFYDDTGPDAYAILDLSIDPAFIGAGNDPLLMTERRTYLTMTDFRPSQSNIANLEIVPQDAAANRQLIVAPGDGNPLLSKPVTGSISVFAA